MNKAANDFTPGIFNPGQIFWSCTVFQYKFDSMQAIRDLISSIIDSAYELPYELPFLASRNEFLPIARQ